MTESDPAAGDRVTMERVLAAPPDLVWRLWTEPAHFAAWYGPRGSTVPVAQIDLRVGGRRLLCMELATPQGPRRMWFTGTYLEVVPHERLSYTDAMADEDGNVLTTAQLGQPEGYPTLTEVHVDLQSTPDGRTRMTLTHIGIAADSPGAMGWTMAMEQLDAHIAETLAS